MLKSIVDNKDRVLENDDSFKSCKTINYCKICIKADIFSKLADLSHFRYRCINLNKDIYEKSNSNRTCNFSSTKFLYTPSDEIASPYFMMDY